MLRHDSYFVDANEALISQFLALVSVLDSWELPKLKLVFWKKSRQLSFQSGKPADRKNLTNRILLVKNNLSFVLISYHS